MLPSKLSTLKKDLETQIYLDSDDKKTLQILKVLNTDTRFQKLINESDFLTKSFSVAPEYCPSCGKRI